MGITVKNGGSLRDLAKTFQKDYGEAVITFGGTWVNTDRITTGLFPLDLAMGGGFPLNKTMVIWGPESSNKTNIALLTLAEHQRRFPEKMCAFFDIENSFDPAWAKKLGVKTDDVAVIRPSFAEQATDMFEASIYADDCGLIVFDSVAAMMTAAEMEKSAEQESMGGASKAIGKMCRKINHALTESDKVGRRPTVILINQVRSKVGFVLGNPDMMPGGNALKHLANIILRVYGKNEMDNKVSTTMPVKKSVKFILDKWKCPVLNSSGTFSMTTIPHNNFRVGQCDDFNTISEYLK
jgi:recombination protein RecA